jgi:GxxExxY protein
MLQMKCPKFDEETECIATIIVDSAFKVHTSLGPGLLESIYELCLVHELRKHGLSVKTQVGVPVVYDGIRLDGGLRLDILVNDLIVIEVKAVELMNPVFEAQILSYLRLTDRRLGFLISFTVPLIKDGIKRIAR